MKYWVADISIIKETCFHYIDNEKFDVKSIIKNFPKGITEGSDVVVTNIRLKEKDVMVSSTLRDVYTFFGYLNGENLNLDDVSWFLTQKIGHFIDKKEVREPKRYEKIKYLFEKLNI